jgi:hypothetical protein
MAGNGPMFDLEDCEDVELNNNKTTSDKFLKAKNTKNIKGSGNESSQNTVANKSWHETAFGKVVIGLIIGGVLLTAKLILS